MLKANHLFTGKERDSESGNDYFGARYYASAMGRFVSPDWSAKEEPVPYAKLDNPQTLNLYQYMENNPLSGADPDGHGDPECLICLVVGPDDATRVGGYINFVNQDGSINATKLQTDIGVTEVLGAGLGVPELSAMIAEVTPATAVATASTTIGVTGAASMGTVDLMGAATRVDTSEAREGGTAASTPAGIATTVLTDGNVSAGAAASDVTSGVKLTANPRSALTDPADAGLTTAGVVSAVKTAVSNVNSFFNPSPPAPPRPPSTPSCRVAGACFGHQLGEDGR